MSKGDSKKAEYFEKVRRFFREYKKVLIANVDNVTSTQMHQVRGALRNKAIILMGKNTMVKKALREVIQEDPKLEAIIPYIYGNIGLVFTNSDLKEIRDILTSNRIQSGAKIGLIAQNDIYVPAGNTGIDPNKTSFFQALSINTKVVKGAIEIVSDVLIVKTGRKVGPSEAALMNMLNLVPFTFGMTVTDIYDNGSIYSPKMLDITDETLNNYMSAALKRVAAVSLAIGLPTAASAPHLLVNACRKLLAVSMSTDYSFPAADKIKEALKNAANVVAAPGAAKGVPAAASKSSEVKVEAPVQEEEEEDLGLDLFG